ncbi:winged helix DNA-binding domain-containing protein [candidate division KSB1 bacterium]|nr:winged helix DNA-binding domain-containing protein [candidate division KSB1 bacterium]NIR70569.1 winged helix DNA-binding domain-containing protein [candidate division KSB1 bacterium]NIS26012.1 winged helix DNA-binding domain-containing protein [candidate division KSB1 bacterium]NIT72834.1 winged helix DNA-binding domain-containing protein [candidate division KSB1 bacterium]NIU26677.1 winged helix DNA-binding domain-containing protein [candidate division KSB1 bacterium]
MTGPKHKFRHWSYHRQRLGKQGTNVQQVLKDIIGVYSSHPTAPLSLHARVKSLDEPAFYELDERRLAFRIPAMRLSIYMLPKDTAHLTFAATVPPASDPRWQKRYSQKNRFIRQEDYEDWKEAILKLADKPLTAADIKKAGILPDASVKLVLNRMAYEGHLLRVGARSLRSNIIRYTGTKSWTGDNFEEVDRDKALAWLAGEYLRAFGPARTTDFQWWAGISVTDAKQAMNAHETIHLEDDSLLLAEDLDEFESFKIPDKDSLVILPRWDSYTMGYAPDGRERFVSPDMQHHVYGSIGATGGNALGVVLVNGAAHGSWESRFAGNKTTVKLKLFEKPSGQLQKDIENQFNELAAFLQAKQVVFEKE